MSNANWLGVVIVVIPWTGLPFLLLMLARMCDWRGLVERSSFIQSNENSEDFGFASVAVSYRNGIFANLRGVCKVEIDDCGVFVACYFPASLIFPPILIAWADITSYDMEGRAVPVVTCVIQRVCIRLVFEGRRQ